MPHWRDMIWEELVEHVFQSPGEKETSILREAHKPCLSLQVQ